MLARSLARLKLVCFLMSAVLLIGGCSDSKPESKKEADAETEAGANSESESNAESSANLNSENSKAAVAAAAEPAEANASRFKFQKATLLMASDEPIQVEEPGYACPTLYDFDGDGAEDLIVGQFNEGKMKWYRNLSSPGEMPKYGAGEWISTGEEPAAVPGVS